MATVLTLAVLLLASLAYSLPSPTLSAWRLDASELQLRTAHSTRKEDSFVSQPAEHTLAQRRALPATTHRRANIVIESETPPDERWMVWVVDTPPGTELRFSGALLGDTLPRTASSVLAVSQTGAASQTGAVSRTGAGVSTGTAARWPAPTVSLLGPIPRYAYLPRRNDIDLAIPPRSGHTALGGIYFGPERLLRPAAQRHAARAAPLPGLAVIAGLFVLGLSALALLSGRAPRDAAALGVGGMALAALGWTAGYGSGVSEAGLTAIRAAALLGLSGACAFILMRPDRLLPRGLMAGGLWAGVGMGLLMAALAALALAWLELFRPLVEYSPVWRLCVMLLGTAPVLLAVSALEAWRGFRDRRSRLDSLSLTVTQQAEALERSRQDAERQMRRRAVMEERERFTRDIHDGVGGQLLGLLLRVRTGMVKPAVIATELQAGLHDLRLVVDAMDHTGDDLGLALSTFRARAEAQLRAAGIALDWQQPDDRISHAVGTGGTLQLFRFMQEAVTNIVRHSGATRALISIEPQEPGDVLRIEIADDGQGLDEADWTDGPGQGLKNLRKRAVVLGATLTRHPGLEGRGLRYRLDLPSDALDLPELSGEAGLPPGGFTA